MFVTLPAGPYVAQIVTQIKKKTSALSHTVSRGVLHSSICRLHTGQLPQLLRVFPHNILAEVLPYNKPRPKLHTKQRARGRPRAVSGKVHSKSNASFQEAEVPEWEQSLIILKYSLHSVQFFRRAYDLTQELSFNISKWFIFSTTFVRNIFCFDSCFPNYIEDGHRKRVKVFMKSLRYCSHFNENLELSSCS
jgi:hypothetical protein